MGIEIILNYIKILFFPDKLEKQYVLDIVNVLHNNFCTNIQICKGHDNVST